jgi:hypothetical protein
MYFKVHITSKDLWNEMPLQIYQLLVQSSNFLSYILSSLQSLCYDTDQN